MTEPIDKLKMLEADKLAADKIHKLCTELELAIQEASNRGMSVQINVARAGAFNYIERPLRCNVQRYMNYAPK